MADIPLPLLAVASILLLVLLGCGVVAALQRRRRAAGAVDAPVDPHEDDENDGTEAAERIDVPARRVLDVQHVPLRRVHGRHSAEPPAPSGAMLLLLVPTVVKRRRSPLDAHPQVVTPSTEPERHAAVLTAVADLVEPADHQPAVGPAEDIDAYRRRVSTTIQAISRQTDPNDPPELLEARMLAAVERLDGPVGFVRPRLSPSGPAGQPRLLGPTAMPPQQLVAAPPVDVPADVAVDVLSDVPEQAPTEDVHPAPFPPETLDPSEVVLPVPPMAAPVEPRRRGLRRRGTAG